jgi:hypothetical protein
MPILINQVNFLLLGHNAVRTSNHFGHFFETIPVTLLACVLSPNTLASLIMKVVEEEKRCTR